MKRLSRLPLAPSCALPHRGLALALAVLAASPAGVAQPLAGTAELDWDGDIASRLVDRADAFLLAKIDQALAAPEAPDRAKLARILGLADTRHPEPQLEVLATVAAGAGVTVRAVRWRAFADVHGEGLLLEPESKPVIGNHIVIPDADEVPEVYAGLAAHPTRPPLALAAARRGERVLVPTLINRAVQYHTLSNREFVYRSAFELGRHIIGYELHKVFSAADWLESRPGGDQLPLAVTGHGEGGMLALFAGALDERFARTTVSGYAGPGPDVWREPAERNVFGLLRAHSSTGVESLYGDRELSWVAAPGPAVEIPPGQSRGKPGRLLASAVRGRPPAATTPAPDLPSVTALPDAAARHARQLHELDRHNQQVLAESPYTREAFMRGLDTSSVGAFSASQQRYREIFASDVIGSFDDPLLAPHPRTREIHINDRVRAYEVVLDVFEDGGLFAYGILVLPADLQPGEARACVVCQHGLEGRPQSTIGEVDHQYYKAFTTRLAERGYVTFAPQNLYIFGDRFRTLQFKANAIGRTLFSVMVPQHRQITRWLGSLDCVDAKRIGFYGLSYGGKSAMRIPPLVDDYCLSICSADFNDWVWKNASSRSPYSYVRTGEYEIFEFDLGRTFNYSEMAALIAPRPFMVERGHFDGVAPDERVALEFAKVRHLYAARLGIPERTEIEWFAGPHTINGEATFAFLDRHLQHQPTPPPPDPPR